MGKESGGCSGRRTSTTPRKKRAAFSREKGAKVRGERQKKKGQEGQKEEEPQQVKERGREEKHSRKIKRRGIEEESQHFQSFGEAEEIRRTNCGQEGHQGDLSGNRIGSPYADPKKGPTVCEEKAEEQEGEQFEQLILVGQEWRPQPQQWRGHRPVAGAPPARGRRIFLFLVYCRPFVLF